MRELPLASTAHLAALDADATPALEQALIREIIHEVIDRGLLRTKFAPSNLPKTILI